MSRHQYRVEKIEMHMRDPATSTAQLKRKISQEVNRLFAVYRLHTNRQPMAGGAQNLVNRCDGIEREDSGGNGNDQELFRFAINPNSTCHFDALPIQVKLLVFSYLSPSDLCAACQASQEWYLLASDELLWQRILARCSRKWDRIYDERNPDFFKRVCKGLPSKQVYLRCHPDNPSTSFRIPNLLQYIVSARPRVVMFGPGLETKTSKLVRSMLTDKHVNEASRFKVTGMVPGEFAGVGSGISLKFFDHAFNLVTLYSNTKSVRQRLSAENRVQQNKLFLHEERKENQDGSPGSMVYEVTPSIQELCRRSQAFIFVVDATKSSEDTSSQPELFAMLCELWASCAAPLLVLACSRGTWSPSYRDAEPLPAIEVVRSLRLGRLNRKWLVQSGEVETLHGIRSGVNWLLSNVNLPFGQIR